MKKKRFIVLYLVVSKQVQPNPYLEDSLRDLITTHGLSLTKVNPAYPAFMD